MDSSVWGKKSKEKKSVPACNFYRETGLYHKSTGPPKYLQWVAEEKLIDKNHEEFTCKLPDGTRSTFLMVFSPDGTMVASTHGNHNVYITYLTNGRNVKTLSGHPRTPWCIAFHPSSNQILASGCLGGQVRVWDLHGGSEIWVVESQTVIASLAFHPTDRVLVIASYNEIHFWDWSQDKPFAKCSTANEREKVRYVSFDKLGHRLITGIANAPRLQSQWDRVAAPQPPPQIRQAEHERRITICYRYMVEQYEQLVQRYYSLSRQGSADQRRNANSRNSQPVTMDRGTDPMEPPPIRTETRCSLCRGDVSGNSGSGTIRGDDGQRPSTSSDSSTPTSEINPTVRPASVNLRNASTQHRGTDEASASRSSSQFLSSHPVLEGVSSVSSNSSATRSEDLTRQEAIRNARDFNSSIRASYLFNRITRLRDQVETGRDLLLRNAENLARRNLSSLMQPRMSPSSPEYLQGFEDIPPSLYESLPPLSPLPPPSPEDTPEDLSLAPPLPAEEPPAPPPPPPLEDPPTPPPPLPPPEDPATPPQPPPPSEDPPTPPPPPPSEDPDHSTTLPIPPPPPIPPQTFSLFNRLSSFLRGQRRTSVANKSNGATTTASENSTDSTESASNCTERKSSSTGNRNVKTNYSENAAHSSTSDTGNTSLSADCSCPESTSSTSTTTATTTTATAAATVLLSLLSSDCRCPESTSSTSTTSATTTIPTATSGLNKEPPLSSSSSSSINRQSTPRAFRDSGSNTENYESNSSDSASGRVLRRNAESSSAIARLRAQFRRLQSAYNTRDRELMLLREAEERAERRLISRLTALLERSPWINSNNSAPGENSNRPSSAPVTSPLFISQPSSSCSSNPTAARASSSSGDGPSSVPTSMASVRCGLHFLTRHIENLSSQVRVDLERGQANHIRTLWHDLHNQICALSLALRAASAPVEGSSQENVSSNSDPAATSGGNEPFPGAARLSSPAASLTSQRSSSNVRAEESTSEASTSGTSSVTEEDDDESDVSPRNWFWLRRQSRRPRPHLRIPNAASKRARIDFRFRMGRGGSSRPDNYYSRLRLYDLLGPSDGSNDDDDDDDEDVENERDEDEEAVDNAGGVQNVNRSSPNSSNSEGPPNRGIKRKSSRILTRSNITNQQPATAAPSPSTSASPDLYYVPARARLNPRVRAFLSLRSQRNAQRQWHHPGYRSQWARDSHLAASESTGDGPSTSRQNNREDTPHREAIRRRARHVLLLMVDSITQFFENDTFTSGSSENLNERTSSLISLLELALELTDLLLTQLDSSRRRRHNYWQSRVDQDYLRTRSEEDRRMRGGINPRRQLSPVMLAMQEQERWDRWISAYTRMFHNNGSGYSRDDHSVRSNSQPLPSSTPVIRISRISATNLYTPLWSLYDSPSSTANNANNTGNNSSTHRTEIRLPVLRVNDGPVPPDEVTVNHINNRLGGRATSPRGSSPPLFYPPLFRPRLLHPRYLGPYYLDDNSTASEDSSQQENRGGGSSSPGDRPGIERFDREFFLMRGHPTAVFMGDSPMIPHHRIQAWDFTKFTLPEISNAGKNIVVEECKIHNDASVDLSQDGKILVTLLPSGRLSITTMLGVYSLEWDTLGQILYTTSFEQSAVSVSLSPTTRHLIVGLASRRLPFFHTDRQTIAQIFRLEGGRPGCESESPSKGKLVLVRELDISRESTDVTSLNCIRWAPTPGEGFVYGTNSGKLKVLR